MAGEFVAIKKRQTSTKKPGISPLNGQRGLERGHWLLIIESLDLHKILHGGQILS